MTLLHCPPHNHSLNHMIQQYEIDLDSKNVLFAGSHDAIEYDTLESHGVARVDWFECNKFVYPDLQDRIRNNHRHHCHFACLGAKDNESKTFYSYRNKKDGASGVYQPDKFNDYITDCPLTGEEWSVKTITFDTYNTEVGLPEYNFAVVDLQGSELEFFQGAKTLLTQKGLDHIICEVSHFNCYKGAPVADDIDNYLAKYDFFKIGYREDWNLGQNLHGDNIYRRRK